VCAGGSGLARLRCLRTQFRFCRDREPPIEAKAEGNMIVCHFPEEG
jgi:hypothetical protein